MSLDQMRDPNVARAFLKQDLHAQTGQPYEKNAQN